MGRVNFPAYPFIKAYPFIREVRVFYREKSKFKKVIKQYLILLNKDFLSKKGLKSDTSDASKKIL